MSEAEPGSKLTREEALIYYGYPIRFNGGSYKNDGKKKENLRRIEANYQVRVNEIKDPEDFFILERRDLLSWTKFIHPSEN